jgi:peptidoglycan/LPS O-acetylase OafA/YrhL
MNKRLLILNGIAIIAVVANHASHIGFLAMFWWTDRYLPVTVPNFDQMGSASYFGLVAQQKLALFSVPSFMFVSGVFIAYAVRGSQSRLSWTMIRKRVTNLLPPYLLWTLVFVIGEIVVSGETFTPVEFVLNFVTIRQSPFFFVPLLIVFFLLSPPLAYLAKFRWKLLLVLALIVQIGALTFSYLRFSDLDGTVIDIFKFIFSSQIAEYIFFYVLGLIAGLRLTDIKKGLYKIRWFLLIATLVFAVLAVAEAEWVFQTFDSRGWRSTTLSIPTLLYILSFIFCYLSFDHVEIPFSKFFYQLGVGTLGIYLVHKSVLLVLPKIIYHVAPFALGYQILLQPLLVSIAIGIPVVMMNLTKRSPIRKHYRVLFG